MDENANYPTSDTGTPVALEQRQEETDGRKFSPSVGRNKDAVRDAILSVVDDGAVVLEIASGTGEHGAHIVAGSQSLVWHYSDVDPGSLKSQTAWAVFSQTERLKGPHVLDASKNDWDIIQAFSPFDAIFCANMIHIAPFSVAEGLIAGAGHHLKAGGKLILYGPFSRKGVIAPSNQRFSEDLKRRDSRWGVRDLEAEILQLAKKEGLALEQVIEMPANNLTVIIQK